MFSEAKMTSVDTCAYVLVILCIALLSHNVLCESDDVGYDGDQNNDQASKTLAMSDEKRLIKHLLEHYHKVGIVGRPVYNTSETVHVNYGLALIQILDLDEKNQVLTTNVWSRYTWKDIVLQWDPAAYGGVKTVRVPSDKIWMPDILLYNHADERLKDKREILALVDYDGSVMWVPLSIFKSTCPIDIQNFPYDIQTCTLKFGSWTYDGTKVDLGFFDDLDEVDITDYMPSNEWRLLAHPAEKHVKYYPCCTEPYIDLTFTVVIKRIGIYYNYTLILPCFLLSILTLVVFWIPPESSAKMIIGLNIFLAFFLQLKVLARATPPGSQNIPVIGSFFCMNMVLITFSTFLSVIVVNLYFRGDKKTRIPKPVRKFFLHGLARMLFMHTDYRKEKVRSKYLVKTHQEHTITIDGRTKRRSRERRKIKSPVLTYNKWEAPSDMVQESPIASRHPTPERTPIHCVASEMEVREMRKTLKSFITKIHQRDSWAKVAKEWRMVALVIDRFFFFIYIVVIAVSLATIFPHDTIPSRYNATNFL